MVEVVLLLLLMNRDSIVCSVNLQTSGRYGGIYIYLPLESGLVTNYCSYDLLLVCTMITFAMARLYD